MGLKSYRDSGLVQHTISATKATETARSLDEIKYKGENKMSTKFIICPEHGKHVVSVEESSHSEYFSRDTAQCPICKKRLVVQVERK